MWKKRNILFCDFPEIFIITIRFRFRFIAFVFVGAYIELKDIAEDLESLLILLVLLVIVLLVFIFLQFNDSLDDLLLFEQVLSLIVVLAAYFLKRWEFKLLVWLSLVSCSIVCVIVILFLALIVVGFVLE